MKRVMMVVAAVLASGCGFPAFTSSMRASGFGPEVMTETKCFYVGRDALPGVVKELGPGWRLFYSSEYTSTGIVGIPANFCFERPLSR